MSDQTKPQPVPYALRLPADLHQRMVALAKAHKRSLNSEIIVACAVFAERPEAPAQPAPAAQPQEA